MMELELREADILWPEGNDVRGVDKDDDKHPKNGGRRAHRKLSRPISIPSKATTSFYDDKYSDDDDDDEEEEEEEDDGSTVKEVVPPHIIVGRRMADKMAFSVCVGNGRTLKGRDLKRVRNSVLKMTGFLER
ncbi:hypothetical protein Cni_G04418 [Canna indica]|uniref:Senescence regulator n=1 Tax=Canna indica TaxID=4628 RepID=A0AAQ3JVY8_9LILI|nr:hypothetical protein Cni_G04418 [Canna indica]